MLRIIIQIELLPAAEAVSKEVLQSTEAVISCKITDITKTMFIEWSGFTAGDNFVPTSGSYDSSTNSQTGILTIRSAAVTTDKTYTCSISSVINEDSALESVDVHLNVYGKKELNARSLRLEFQDMIISKRIIFAAASLDGFGGIELETQ